MVKDYKDDTTWLMLGGCLERMKEIPDGSVDMILCDPPYGTTACKWDSIIPLDKMWVELKRVIKVNGAIVMTASQPFTTTLISSNIGMFKYCWVWKKSKKTGHMQAKVAPLKAHEDIVVFSHADIAATAKNKVTYFPQGTKTCLKTVENNRCESLGSRTPRTFNQTVTNYPVSVIEIPSEGSTVHPTQKPVALMEYLIKTYTNESETVLDFTIGSGTTGVACKNLNRKFIGIEMDDNYFNIAKERILGSNK